MMLKQAAPFASLLLLLGAPACSVSVSSSDSCGIANIGCVAAATGYACTGSARPEYYNPDLVCSADGVGDYCCWPTQCTGSNSVSARCGGSGADGYSCTGGSIPSNVDPNLVCSEGVPGAAGDVEYCCYTPSAPPPANPTCDQDPTVQGCAYPSYGFSCTSSATPDMEYSNLVCSAPTQGANALLYCCTYH